MRSKMNNCKALLPLLLLLLCHLTMPRAKPVDADANTMTTVSLAVRAFYNPTGQTMAGACCDNPEASDCRQCGVEWYHCDPMFAFCIEPMEQGTRNTTACSTDWKRTGLIDTDKDSIVFADYTDYGQWHNPQKEKIEANSKGFNFKYIVWDSDPVGETLIDSNVIAIPFDKYPPGIAYDFDVDHERAPSAHGTKITFYVSLYVEPQTNATHMP